MVRSSLLLAPSHAPAAKPAVSKEELATRLLTATRKKWYDPDVDVDWDQPFIDGLYFMPPDQVSLYGTPLWARMSEQQRIDLSRHESSSIAQCGVWLELILDQLLLRHVYNEDPRSAHAQYALTEIADECRHSIMFARMVEKFDTPRYGPQAWARILGRIFPAVIPGIESFGSMLMAEEILDSGQRLLMKDERVQPLVRRVSAIHVAEESRHIGYARAEMMRMVAAANPVRREIAAGYISVTGLITGNSLVNPKVYAECGIDVWEARRAILHSPHRREIHRIWTGRLQTFFTEVGLMQGPTGRIWKLAGLR
jgi:hypothetical protein